MTKLEDLNIILPQSGTQSKEEPWVHFIKGIKLEYLFTEKLNKLMLS